VELSQSARFEELDDEIVVLAGCALGFMGQGQPPHVLMVDDGTQIAHAGVQSDDILVKVDNKDPKLMTQQEFRVALQEAKSLHFERPAPGDGDDSDAASEKATAQAPDSQAAEAPAGKRRKSRSRKRQRRHEKRDRNGRGSAAPAPPDLPSGPPRGCPPPQSSDPARPAFPHVHPNPHLQQFPTSHERPPVPHHMWPPPPGPGYPFPPHPGYRPAHPLPPHAMYPIPAVNPWHGRVLEPSYARPPPRSSGPPASSSQSHHASGGRPQKRDRNLTLERNESGGSSVVVERLPMSMNNMDSLSDYFDQFGAVVAIQVNHNRSEAIVSFRKLEHAEEALKVPPFGDSSIGLRPYKTRAGQRGPHEAPFSDRPAAESAASAEKPVEANAAGQTQPAEEEVTAEEGAVDAAPAESTAPESAEQPSKAEPTETEQAASEAVAAKVEQPQNDEAPAAGDGTAEVTAESTPQTGAPGAAPLGKPETHEESTASGPVGEKIAQEEPAADAASEQPTAMAQDEGLDPARVAASDEGGAVPAVTAPPKNKRTELEEKRHQLLDGLTKQLLAVMAKTRDPSLSEAAKQKWQTMLVTLKDKIAKLTPSKPEPPVPKAKPAQTPTKQGASNVPETGERVTTFAKPAGGAPRPATTMLRVSNLPMELQGDEGKLRETLGDALVAVQNWAADNTSCILVFSDRKKAEAAIEKGQKEWGFTPEWPAKPPAASPAKPPSQRWTPGSNRWPYTAPGKRKYGAGMDLQDDVVRQLGDSFDAQSIASTMAFETDIDYDIDVEDEGMAQAVVDEDGAGEGSSELPPPVREAAMEGVEDVAGSDAQVAAESVTSVALPEEATPTADTGTVAAGDQNMDVATAESA